MKLTLNWLRGHVDLPTDDPAEITEAFERLGYEVEGTHAIEPQFRGVVIGRVLEVAAHPNADKVRVCAVDLGGETSEIVCGAWNFDAGAVVPVAVPGAVLAGGFEIGRRTIRGVVSHGMICSERELGLGDEAAGIMVLDADYPAAADSIGRDLTSLLDLPDTFYDLNINPNRPDCMSVVGLARELAAHFRVPFTDPVVDVAGGGQDSSLHITIEDEEGCPRFYVREVRDVTVGPSPHWLRARLRAAGVRPISNVVDASNYVMLELGHPTHAFDAERLGDQIVVRRARAGETVRTLDDVERSLQGTDIVVADGRRPVAIAGIMGGADTEVHGDTTRVFVEAAYWSPPDILMTSKRLGLRSEASARFERGMDPNFCAQAADSVAALLADIAGAQVAAGPVDRYPRRIEPRTVALPLSEVPRVLGATVPEEAIVDLLTRTGFGVAGDDPLAVTVPTRRPDVARPVDLVEDIARLHGFDKVPDTVATGPGGGLPVAEVRRRRLRAVMAGAGYHEVLLMSFIGDDDLDGLGLPDDDLRRKGIRLTNPLRDEEGVLRTTLLPGLLRAAALNAGRHVPDAMLFELGKIFLAGTGKLPEQPEHLGFVASGRVGADWETAGRWFDVRDATGLWEVVADALTLGDPSVRPAHAPGFHPGRCAELLVGATTVGVVGEIHPATVAAHDLTGPVIGGEIELDVLLMERDPWSFRAPSPFPPAVFDLAFEVDQATAAGTLLGAIDAAGGDLVEARTVFDVFAGPPIPPGRKSIAVHLTLRHPDRTLTDEEVKPVRRAIVDAVEAATGASLRGEL
jgi:phenylalanyl-tRNA synthetase beta chain